MTIHFYIDNEEETELFTIYEQPIAPFKVGDEIKLSVNDIVLKNYINAAYKYRITTENNKLKELCHLKTAKIIKMNNYVDFNALDNKINIEYYCKILDL